MCLSLCQDEEDSKQPNEKVLPNGYIVALACGPLKKPRYINENIEKELQEFKLEIKEKFEKSVMNQTFVFPRPLLDQQEGGPSTKDVTASPVDRSRKTNANLSGTHISQKKQLQNRLDNSEIKAGLDQNQQSMNQNLQRDRTEYHQILSSNLASQ